MKVHAFNDLTTLFVDIPGTLQQSEVEKACSHGWIHVRSVAEAKELFGQHRFGMIFLYATRESEIDVVDELVATIESERERWQSLRTLIVLCYPHLKNPTFQKLRDRMRLNEIRVEELDYFDACCVSSSGEQLFLVNVDERRGEYHSFPDGLLPIGWGD